MKEKIIEVLSQYIVTERGTCYCNTEINDLADEVLTAIEQKDEQKVSDNPIAYEFINSEGHCYVDYIKRPDLEQEGFEYKQIPLYYVSSQLPKDVIKDGKNTELDLPSDEEIEREYPIIEITEDINSEASNEQLIGELRNLCKRIGAKWMREEIKKRNKNV